MKAYRVSFEVTIDENAFGGNEATTEKWLGDFIENNFSHYLTEDEEFSELEITELKG
jgi:hypothetical protein